MGKKKGTWSSASREYFAALLAEHGPGDYKQLQRLMRQKDASWTFDEQQLRSRVATMKRIDNIGGGGMKRAAEKEKEKKSAKKPRQDPLAGPAAPLSASSTSQHQFRRR
jgi:hypothetical protein